MVSFKSLITLAIAATSVSSFNLLHDDKGFAILPPTNIVLDHLKEVGKKLSLLIMMFLTLLKKMVKLFMLIYILMKLNVLVNMLKIMIIPCITN